MAKTISIPVSKPAPLINIGISEKDRLQIAKGLSHLLADTYTLYLTTHNFHWNVTDRCSTPCTRLIRAVQQAGICARCACCSAQGTGNGAHSCDGS